LCPGLIIFFAHVLQHPLGQQGLRQHLLQLGVLPFQCLQTLRLVEVHLPELLLPTMERDLGDVLLPAQFHEVLAAIGLPQNADLVLRRISFA
jgi:hypothetical protein